MSKQTETAQDELSMRVEETEKELRILAISGLEQYWIDEVTEAADLLLQVERARRVAEAKLASLLSSTPKEKQ